MIILDTDTLSIAQHPDSAAAKVLRRRMVALPATQFVGTTIITYEEQTRGWFTFLSKARQPAQRIEAYARLLKHLDNWRLMNVLPFDDRAEADYASLRSLKLKLGASDLKIAAIARVNDGLLLSRNLQDFGKIPHLRVEDWTQG